MIKSLCVSDTRLFTTADDKIVKSWAFDKGQPNSCKEDLVKPQQITVASYADKPAIIVVGFVPKLTFYTSRHHSEQCIK